MSFQPGFLPRRPLGRTGFLATAVGAGDLADRSIPLDQCAATLRRALDAGVNVVDTAPLYEDGYSEQIVGAALRDVPRDGVFLIDKIEQFDEPAGPQVDASLQRLGLGHTDAFVFHNLSQMDAYRRVVARGGFDEIAECVRAGKTRFRGISSHSPEVLEAALAAGFCDIVMFPAGPFVDPRFVDRVLPLAKTLRVATVCFKTFGAGKLLGDTEGYNQPLKLRPRGKLSSGGAAVTEAVLPRLSVAECLHYTLSLDPGVALLGLSFPNEQDAAFAALRAWTGPLHPAAMQSIRERAAAARHGKGPCWWNPDPEA